MELFLIVSLRLWDLGLILYLVSVNSGKTDDSNEMQFGVMGRKQV